jgi:hypothetical protein
MNVSGFLKAAKELLTPSGILIAAYLNAWGIARSLLSDAPAWFADRTNLRTLLVGAEFVEPYACSSFTECCWSTPDDAKDEMRMAGLTVLEEAGAEGLAGGLRYEVSPVSTRSRLNP